LAIWSESSTCSWSFTRRAEETNNVAAISVEKIGGDPQDIMASGHATEGINAVARREECFLAQDCIDQYLWSLYQRAPKIDAVKKQEQVKVTVTKKGKTRTVTKTVVKLVDEDFGWKDPKAAERAGMPLMDYVIGGMDRSFKLKLYRALRAMDGAGLEPGITRRVPR
jgi:hypothetical protein